jgi:hypothetical protein
MTTALRAACQRLIPLGTSVLPTSMSVFKTATCPSPRVTAATSSPKGAGMARITSKWFWIISIIFRSPKSLLVSLEEQLSGLVLRNQ